MKIAGYIGDLLYEYECVVIPGLGGFLTRDHPAYIHPIKHYFKPPHREIVFNPMLRTNDGLLLNYIARSEKLAYHDAKSRLDRFVVKCLEVLNEGKKINFRNIGNIQYNKEKQIIFEPDTNQNYLSESFGLSSFVSPPIKREDFQQRVEKVFSSPPRSREEQTPEPPPTNSKKPQPAVEKRMLASRRPGKLKRQLVIVGAAATLLFAAWATMNYQTVNFYYDKYKSQASILPFFYVSPNEYVIHHLDQLPVKSMIPIQDFSAIIGSSTKAQAGINDLIPAQSYKVPLDIVESEPEVVIAEPFVVDTAIDALDTNDSSPETPDEMVVVESVEKDVIEPAVKKEEIIVQPAKVVQSKQYHIIAGAFKEKENAVKLIDQLKTKNFSAGYAGQTSGGLWRVAYASYSDETTALQQLEAVKNNENRQAWLLVL